MKRVERHHAKPEFDSAIPPVLAVNPGEAVVVETDYGAPQVVVTGPIFVEGARPGDALVVRVQQILVLDALYWWFEQSDLRGFRKFLARYCRTPVIQRIPVEQGQLVLGDRLSVPVNPVLGAVGVAPHDGPVSADRRGTHGGNMDCSVIREGATVFLPVYVEGALFSVGDVHAAQSDGEVLRPPESKADVGLFIDLRKGLDLKGPFVETENDLHAIGSAEDLETALELAMVGMMDLLSTRLSADYEIAQLLGSYAHTRICQIAGPDYTLRVSLDKRIVPGFSL